MKKMIFAAIAGMLLAGCSSDNGEEQRVNEQTDVTMTFSPYQMEAMTRAAVSIADVVNHLDVWIYESGSEVAAIHQTTSDADFGSVTVTLDKTKTYTLYAIGHKADGATLSDGVISFTDDKVTHAMYYSTTFSPATTTSLSCLMNRIVADFRLDITDEIPSECKKFRFTITHIYDRWNVSTGGTHSLDRVSTINYSGTSAIFNVYAITTDAQTLHTVTVEALDADGNALVPAQVKTFENVPLRNGYKTTYRGEEGRGGSKVKRSLILQTSPRMASLGQGMCSFLPSCYPQVDKVLNKGTLTVRQKGRIL